MMRKTTKWISVLSFIYMATSPNLAHPADPLHDLEKILTAWESSRSRIRTVNYEITGTVMVPKGRHNSNLALDSGPRDGDYPSVDYRYVKTANLHVDFENNRFRKEIREEVFHGNIGNFLPHYCINTFDGRTFKSFSPREDNTNDVFTPSISQPDIIIGGSDLTKHNGPFFHWDEYPVFFAHGIFNTSPDPRRSLRATIEMKQLRVHGYATQDDGRRVVLRTTADRHGEFDEIWVDLERSSVITRWVNFRPDRVAARTDINYQQTAGEWIPSSWTMTYYEKKDWIDATYNHRVVNCLINTPIDTSELELERKQKPGMVIRDNGKSRGLYYVESDGTLSPLKFGPDGQRLKTAFRWPRLTLLLCLVILIAACINVFYRLYHRKAIKQKQRDNAINCTHTPN
jgi:hypothetical protein